MKVMDERPITIAEVEVILKRKDKEYKDEDRDLLYEQKRALDYVKKFSKLKLKEATELSKKLAGLPLNLGSHQIVKIVDLLPETVDDVRSIFSKERFKYSEEEIKKILEIVDQYR